MRVSVLVPTRNRLDWLGECLASLARQTMEPDQYEVIVVNDGGASPRQVVERSTLARVRLIEQAHQGLSAALNTALVQARAPYCTVSADDDHVLPDKLTVLANALDGDPGTTAAYGLPRYLNPRGQPIARPAPLLRFLHRYPRLTWTDVQAGSGLWIHGTAPMYRTEAVRQIEGWDEALRTAEEYDLHLRLLHAGGVFVGLPVDVVTYRAGGKSRDPAVRANRAAAFARIYGKFGTTRAAYNSAMVEV